MDVKKNTVVTPFGTFTRKSDTAYGFAAVVEAAVDPDHGLRVVGNRKGELVTKEGYSSTRYHVVWSRTAAGAHKNGENYVWAKTRVLGVFPVTVS